MTSDLTTYRAVAECRRLVLEDGLPLPAAAADAADRYGLYPLHVAELAGHALHSCRTARRA